MTSFRLACSTLLVIALAACAQPSADAPSASTVEPARASRQAPPEPDRVGANASSTPKSSEPLAPAPPVAIRDIFGVEATSDGAPVANGSYATYWCGYRYEVDGAPYFTAFVQQTPQKFGKPEDEFPDPSAKANLTEATYALTGTGAAAQWTLLGSQPHVGYAGAAEKVDPVDAKHPLAEATAVDGRRVLAVPTAGSANGGVTTFGYELLVRGQDKLWTYAGRVDAGSDNGAGCVQAPESRDTPCAASRGVLRFETPAKGLPDISVSISGSDIDKDGKVHRLDPTAIQHYRYDERASTYRSTPS